MHNDQDVTRGKFSLGSDLDFQQDLAPLLEVYLRDKFPEMGEKFNEIFPESPGFSETLGERIAARCCLPVTMLRYIQAAGLLLDISPMDYIDKMWGAFDVDGSTNWLRPKLSKLTRQEYGVPIISCGVLWLERPLTDQDKQQMIASGYCDEDQIASFLYLLHGKTLEEIIAYSPVVITIKNPVGARVPHAVIAWEIKDNELYYSTTDIRDGGRVALTKMPLERLMVEETKNGAISLLA